LSGLGLTQPRDPSQALLKFTAEDGKKNEKGEISDFQKDNYWCAPLIERQKE
jgi:hypothetical protein